MLCRTTHTSTRYASPLRNLSVVCINRMQPHPVFTNYQATRDGHVYNKKGRMLKGHKQNGYLVVGLTHNGCVRLHTVHLLVYEVFFGVEPRDRFHVDHINGIRDDNRLENLQRLTHQQHAQKTRRDHPDTHLKIALAKRRSVIRTKEGREEEFASIEIAATSTPRASSSGICDCLCGRYETHAGATWRYKADVSIDNESWVSLSDPECSVGSHGRIRAPTGKMLTLRKVAGYLNVSLNRKSPYAHVLVCCAFHGKKPTPEHTVDHIDRDKHNNVYTNLRWATRKEQMADRGRFFTTGVM